MPVTQTSSRFDTLAPSPEWAFNAAGRSETNYITHGYHRYPAKFIPNLVQKLIDDYTEVGDMVVDPFGGCGTTLVEAKVRGRRSHGFDINPVAKLITQTKIAPIKPKSLEKTLAKFQKDYEATKAIAPEIHFERLRYWFGETELAELNRIYVCIKKIKNQQIRRFYLCAFSHILKNSSRWLMKSIKPTVDKEKDPTAPITMFAQHLRFMTKRNEQFYDMLAEKGFLKVSAKMRIANSTKHLPLTDESVDLIVTSPPYVTSYEYADLHQLSLLWFGNDKRLFKKWGNHMQDFNDFRKKFIGTSIRKNTHAEDVSSELGTSIVEALSQKDMGTARSAAHYFSDMNKSFTEMYRLLKPGKHACIIIGNTEIQGVSVSNAEVASEQMKKIGFIPVTVIKREVANKMITPWRDSQDGRFTGLTNPNKKRAYQYEYIVVMQKPASVQAS